MKVGDYVRTIYGDLWQPKEIREIDIKWLFDDYYLYDKDSVKSSPNITDLIEVGDILTIRDVFGNVSRVEVDENFKLLSGKIVSIVTKEQFEEIEYKL